MLERKSLMLLITYNCNLRCSYCYEPKTKNFKMSVQKAKQILIERIQKYELEYNTIEVQFMGGEPFLEFPLIKEVSEWLWTLNLKCNLVIFAPTNGTILTDEIKNWLTHNKERFTIGLSFDGDKLMQDLNRTMSSYKVNLSYFVNNWPDQSVKMTISPETISTLASGVKYLHQSGFKHITADLAMGNSVKWTQNSLLTYKLQLSQLEDYYLEHPELYPFSMLNIDLRSLIQDNNENVKSCGCGETLECIDWTGKSYACHLFSPVALPVEKANRSNEIYDFHNHTIFDYAICRKCMLNTICNHCYGMNYICNDDIRIPSPFHCAAFKIRFAENCKFQLKLAERNNDNSHIKIINNIINKIK